MIFDTLTNTEFVSYLLIRAVYKDSMRGPPPKCITLTKDKMEKKKSLSDGIISSPTRYCRQTGNIVCSVLQRS